MNITEFILNKLNCRVDQIPIRNITKHNLILNDLQIDLFNKLCNKFSNFEDKHN